MTRPFGLVVPPVLVAGVLVGPTLGLRDRLPSHVAVHWTVSGRPDASAGLATSVAVIGCVWLAQFLVVVVLAPGGRTPSERAARRAAVAGEVAVTVLLLGGHAAVLAANVGTSDWHRARLSGWWPPGVIGSAVVVGILTWSVTGGGVAGTPPRERTDASVPAVGDDEVVVWASQARNGVARWTGRVAVGVGLVATVWPGPVRIGSAPGVALALTLLFTGVSLIWVSVCRVVVRGGELSASMGPWRWPTRRVRLDSGVHADRAAVTALSVGGWGLRRVPGGGSAVMVRGGDCLVVRDGAGRTLTISVDDASVGARAVMTVVTRVGARPSAGPDADGPA